MTAFILTYDVRSSHHDYTRLYSLLNEWKAAHLQDSVWLADLIGTAPAILDTMRAHMHPSDTLAVIELAAVPEWAVVDVRPTGLQWLRARQP